MAKKLRRLLRIASLALLFAGTAMAQSTSSITGVVTDASTGKPVVGAVVVVTSPALEAEQTAVTEAGGKYTVPGLPAGDYSLAVQFEGYKPFERADLKVKEGVTLRANAAVVPEAVQMEEVVVTGSRIRRKDLNTPAPVTVLNREAVQSSGKVAVGDFLQSLPEQGNAINTGVNNGGDGSVRISLRSLGDARTLVLVNGRRMVPGGSGADSSVDLNTIPTAAIERIEVLKDGASAVYGSDAIGGVVNIITRKNYNGADISWYTGLSSKGDAQINDVAVTFGSSNEGGSIIFSAGYYDQQKAMASDRDFSKAQLYYDATGFNSGTPGEYKAGSSRTPGGRVSLGGSGNALMSYYQTFYDTKQGNLIHDSTMTPAPDCLTAAGVAPGATPTAAQNSACQWRKMNSAVMAPEGDLYNFAPYNYLLTPSRRFNLYAAGDRKLGDYARAFFEAMYVNRRSKEQLAPEPLIIGPGGVEQNGELVVISKDNYYNPFGKDITAASRRLNEFGNRIHERDIHTVRVVGGLDGTLPDFFGPLKGWSWDTSFNYGRTFGTYLLRGNLQSSRVAAALGPSAVVGGVPVCVDASGNVIAGCVPLDLFNGAGSITQDQVAPLAFNGTSQGYNDLVAVQANANGDLFKLFSERPVGLALGYEYRYQAGGFTNDPLTAHFDSSNGGSFDTDGNYNVHEGYAELSIPIVSNVPFFEELELDAALRVFRYSNFGSDKTYKLGARWSPFRDLTVRGTYSTAFRAPSVSDLFTGQFDNFPNVSDPCAHASSPQCDLEHASNNGDDSTQLRSTNGGNPDLKPETAKIYTMGLVYQPHFLPDLSLTLDYYNVAIEKAIATIGEATILAGCYGGSNPEYCKFVERDPNNNNQITNIVNLNANVGKESSAGIDFAARYDLKTADLGRFGFTFDLAWLQKHDQTLADGSVVKGKGTFDLQTNAGAGGTNPAWKFNAAVNWGLGNFGAGVNTKFLSSFKECGDSNGDFSGSGLCYVDDTYQRRVKSYNVYDLYVNYRLTTGAGKTSITAGMNNVFNANPPKIYNGFASATDQYSYDQLGRYFFLRLNHSI